MIGVIVLNNEVPNKAISGMQQHLAACEKYLTELAKGYRSPEKYNTLLDAAMQQVELCCIELRCLFLPNRCGLTKARNAPIMCCGL